MGKLYSEDLLPVWKSHFESLTTHSMHPNFTHDRFDRACLNMANISKILDSNTPLPVPITTREVSIAIRSLKKRKTKDGMGLTAEHLQAAIHPIAKFLTSVINDIIAISSSPDCIKEGILHPIQKKKKKIKLVLETTEV